MRRALFLPVLLLLAISSHAHKAIEDETETPEEMQAQTDSASKSNAEKAKQDPNFFDNLDQITAKEDKDMMYYF